MNAEDGAEKIRFALAGRVVSKSRDAAQIEFQAPAPELLDAAKYGVDCLQRYVAMLDPDCTCEPCPQCGKLPSECTVTECASTCQCNDCDHCRGVMAIEALNAAISKAQS